MISDITSDVTIASVDKKLMNSDTRNLANAVPLFCVNARPWWTDRIFR